ncbi:MAG TPA: hypothetical protein VGQ76_13620 [Thermoanaerobaculia bacterium]|jgi:hypothetical protein|nr:hypothetical protein [Thermoanaerobaculia bacterium]
MRRSTVVRLHWQLAWSRVLLWIASFGRPVTPTPEVHFYLADLHFQLAFAYEALGRAMKARRHRAIANQHAAAGPPADLPPAVAVAMPVPPDDAA